MVEITYAEKLMTIAAHSRCSARLAVRQVHTTRAKPAAAATQPAAAVPTAPLSAWLQAHGLTYGLAGYWNSSAITLESGNRVRVRAVLMDGRQVIPYLWETNTLWFDASRYYANFVIIDLASNGLSPFAEQAFGKPVRVGHLARWEILIYQKNLLKQLAMAGTGP